MTAATGGVTDPAVPLRDDGVAANAAAVAAARARMAESLERLQTVARTQVGGSVEKMLWKVTAAGAAVVAGLGTRALLNAAWRAVRKHDPPSNPAAAATTWPEALAWGVATAVGAGVARVVAQRGAAAGWQRARGHRPPGLDA